MAKIHHIRGALLEEAVLYLLSKVGYSVVRTPADSIDPTDLHAGHSGLEIEGRGTHHQIDAVAEHRHSPAFMYPLRLLVEAKFYADDPVGIQIVRNSVGVLKDISENYFSKNTRRGRSAPVRFNYQSAVFGVSGYTTGAVLYAVAHQIFLIEYKSIPLIAPLIGAIRSLEEIHFTSMGMKSIASVRNLLRFGLNQGAYPTDAQTYVRPAGLDIINNSITPALLQVGGSYFGMLQGRWPLHLLTATPLPAAAFENDLVQCRISGTREGGWRFTPSGVERNSDKWFELQFFLPTELAELVSRSWGNTEEVAGIKQQHFSFITLSGKIGGHVRNVRLELDRAWLRQYLDGMRT